MAEPTLKRATGNWVVGDQFWDREAEVALFIERLNEGAHLLLTAPRRIGKTSLMKEVARRSQGRFISLYVDLQKAESPSDAVVELSLAAREYEPAWKRFPLRLPERSEGHGRHYQGQRPERRSSQRTHLRQLESKGRRTLSDSRGTGSTCRCVS